MIFSCVILTIWGSSQINRELTTIQNAMPLNKYKYKMTKNRKEDPKQTEGDRGSEILFDKRLGIVSIRRNLVTLQKEIYW